MRPGKQLLLAWAFVAPGGVQGVIKPYQSFTVPDLRPPMREAVSETVRNWLTKWLLEATLLVLPFLSSSMAYTLHAIQHQQRARAQRAQGARPSPLLMHSAERLRWCSTGSRISSDLLAETLGGMCSIST